MSRAAESFHRHFGAHPAGIAIAPGRVNLVGEHIDYHGLAVLPATLDRSIRVAFRAREDRWIRIANVEPDYGERGFALDSDRGRDPPGDWGNYLRAAAIVAAGYGAARGIDALVDSELPVAAGLSSSSALVVATALAFLESAGLHPEPAELAGRLAEGEQFVGTRGGGMDQAACLGGRAGHALHIEFGPLRWTPVAVPGTWRVVVAHSGVGAEKSGAAREAYNERRHDGEAALEAVAADLGRPGASYRELRGAFPEALLLERGALRLPPTRFRRFRHVITEAGRVAAGVECLRHDDPVGFGALLTRSQESLREDYAVSHPRLDALVGAALAGGADGARLTGAGFGGCIVAVCSTERVEAVLGAVRAAQAGMGITEPHALAFVARIGDGARVVTPGWLENQSADESGVG